MTPIATAYQYRALTAKPARVPISNASRAVLVIIVSAAVGIPCQIVLFFT